MSDQADNTPLGDDDTQSALEPLQLTSRLILWRIAKELTRVAKELAQLNTTLKQISNKLR